MRQQLVRQDVAIVAIGGRETVDVELEKENMLKYMKRRKIRELVHKTKTEGGGILHFEDVGDYLEIDDSTPKHDIK